MIIANHIQSRWTTATTERSSSTSRKQQLKPMLMVSALTEPKIEHRFVLFPVRRPVLSASVPPNCWRFQTLDPGHSGLRFYQLSSCLSEFPQLKKKIPKTSSHGSTWLRTRRFPREWQAVGIQEVSSCSGLALSIRQMNVTGYATVFTDSHVFCATQESFSFCLDAIT